MPEMYHNIKVHICFIAELMLAFDSNPNMVKNLSPNFKQFASRCVMLLNVLVRSLD